MYVNKFVDSFYSRESAALNGRGKATTSM